jgi:hypothetical protein
MTLENCIDHTMLLNYLIEIYGLKTYLEIGVQQGKNFKSVNINAFCKFGVDPDENSAATIIDTSDGFFYNMRDMKNTIYDLVLIDGLHTETQARKDFNNSLRYLNKGGYVVVHDTVPEQEVWTLIPRVSRQWTGSVYKFACTLSGYDGIDFVTFPMDYGITVVWKNPTKKGTPINHEITWEYYLENREWLLSFISDENKLPEMKF